MKLKQGIAGQSMPCRQHETLLQARVAVATDRSLLYFPTFRRAIPVFRNFSNRTGDIFCVLRENLSILCGFGFGESLGTLL